MDAIKFIYFRIRCTRERCLVMCASRVLCMRVRFMLWSLFFFLHFVVWNNVSLDWQRSLNNDRLTSVFNILISYSYESNRQCVCARVLLNICSLLGYFSLSLFSSFDAILISKDEAIATIRMCYFFLFFCCSSLLQCFKKKIQNCPLNLLFLSFD